MNNNSKSDTTENQRTAEEAYLHNGEVQKKQDRFIEGKQKNGLSKMKNCRIGMLENRIKLNNVIFYMNMNNIGIDFDIRLFYII